MNEKRTATVAVAETRCNEPQMDTKLNHFRNKLFWVFVQNAFFPFFFCAGPFSSTKLERGLWLEPTSTTRWMDNKMVFHLKWIQCVVVVAWIHSSCNFNCDCDTRLYPFPFPITSHSHKLSLTHRQALVFSKEKHSHVALLTTRSLKAVCFDRVITEWTDETCIASLHTAHCTGFERTTEDEQFSNNSNCHIVCETIKCNLAISRMKRCGWCERVVHCRPSMEWCESSRSFESRCLMVATD